MFLQKTSYIMMRILLLLMLWPKLMMAKEKKLAMESMIQPAVFSLTLVMVHDVVSPPVAARYYAYCMTGAYDIVSKHDASIVPPASIIKNYTPAIIKLTGYDYRMAAVFCIYETGRLMLPSGIGLKEDEDKFVAALKRGKFSQKVIDASMVVGRNVAAQVFSWSKSDDYNKLSAKLHYTPLKSEGNWYPTPPSYLQAVEPNWKTVRPMMIDSCSQFKPLAPVSFGKDSSSDFFALAKEVHEISLNPAKGEQEIASFWDCNPFAVSTEGHMMIAFKKITPGGHWMNIAAIAAKKASLSFNQSMAVQTLVSLTLMDAFISSWDEKYRSNRIRPETFINRYMDHKWQPLLQTPPFPEYPSAHSVISTASASLLEYLLGENFSFTDDSEEFFGLGPRPFNSFMSAANEAAISRLYGGIHFRDAIENGQVQGRQIGQFVIQKMRSAGVMPLIRQVALR